MLSLNLALMFYLLGNVVDVITTNRVLDAGGRELTPFIAKVMDVFGNKWGAVKLALALAAGLALHDHGYELILWLLGCVFWAAAIHNHRAGK
ncbi:hypothetical protein [Sulfitobacter sp. CS16]|uniref:hypothetical protein n=1 Tax=Sulfitobacter sp. CS16 TaxID=3368573 RepID=UPI0037468B63